MSSPPIPQTGDPAVPTPPDQHRHAVWWLIAATAVWGLSFPIMKVLHLVQAEFSHSWFLAAWLLCLRFALSGIILLAADRTCRRPTASEWWQGLGLAAFAAPGLILQADGLGQTEASTSAFLTQAYCILLPLWAAFAHRTWLSRRVLLCTALVVIGIGILSKIDLNTLHIGPGEWKTLLAAAFFTGQILWLERPTFANNRPNSASLVMFMAIAAACLPLAVSATPSLAAFSTAWLNGRTLLMLAVITLGCTLFSFLMMNRWQKHVSATEAGLIYCLEPVFTAAYVFFLPALLGQLLQVDYSNEALTTSILVGGGLVTLANLFLQSGPAQLPAKNLSAKAEPLS